MLVDRKTFLGLIRESSRLTARSASRTKDCRESIKAAMPKARDETSALVLGGGDEELTYAMWEFPTRDGPRQLTLVSRRTRLWKLESRTPPAASGQARMFG